MGLVLAAVLVSPARAQQRAYLGFAYPAGGQQGSTFQIRLGGQQLEGTHSIHVSGEGVTARLLEYQWTLSPQDARLLREQSETLRKQRSKSADVNDLLARINYRLGNWVNQPACKSIASIVIAEVTVAPDAPPGEREMRVVTTRGVSNPLVFDVGQIPESTRPPMKTSAKQILGKEGLALRNRPASEIEVRVDLPCTLNGQIASREVNRYRFEAKKGQRLVADLRARQLIPYIADAVPGWFQPVMALYDAEGREVVYADDYRFRPDPVILCEIPGDGEYVLEVRDSIFRGREDFVYRVTLGELPFVTSIFPLGGREGETPSIKMKGWNLDGAIASAPSDDMRERVAQVVAKRKGIVSNPMPFAVDTLPEIVEEDPGESARNVRKVTLPVMANGRIVAQDDWDIYEFRGKAGETVVAEVMARRLDSPLDSVLKLTDSDNRLVAFNDDWEDLATGLNTHHADSYFMAKLPADGVYRVHIGDAARKGGGEYSYRLRISHPRPDFALRVVPSGAIVRNKQDASVTIHAVRKDGFDGPINLALKDPPPGFTSRPASITGTQTVARLSFRGGSSSAGENLVQLRFEGRAKVGETKITREAVPADDRMQAFLWRHLLPAQEFCALVDAYKLELPPKRTPPELPEAARIVVATTNKFSKSQVAGRLKQLGRLYADGLFTDAFYLSKAAECFANP